MTRLFSHFLNVAVTFRIWSSGKKNPYLICVTLFSNLGNWSAFGLLQIRCLFYIWTTLLLPSTPSLLLLFCFTWGNTLFCFIWLD